jgi:hypothetical protein
LNCAVWHIISYYIPSCHIISHHVISYHITFRHNNCTLGASAGNFTTSSFLYLSRFFSRTSSLSLSLSLCLDVQYLVLFSSFSVLITLVLALLSFSHPTTHTTTCRALSFQLPNNSKVTINLFISAN